jgi:hypothetical protein
MLYYPVSYVYTKRRIPSSCEEPEGFCMSGYSVYPSIYQVYKYGLVCKSFHVRAKHAQLAL